MAQRAQRIVLVSVVWVGLFCCKVIDQSRVKMTSDATSSEAVKIMDDMSEWMYWRDDGDNAICNGENRAESVVASP